MRLDEGSGFGSLKASSGLGALPSTLLWFGSIGSIGSVAFVACHAWR